LFFGFRREKMKMKSLVIVLVCLMATGVFATNTWNSNGGSWSDSTKWSGLAVPTGAEQIKITSTTQAVCNLDGTTVTNNFVGGKVTLGGPASGPGTLNIMDSAVLNLGTEMQIGDSATNGGNGRVNQTGGTVSAVSGTSTAKIEVGYKTGTGTYVISGGTIAGSATSQLIVGGAGSAGATGTFRVQGNAASITVGLVYVGCKDSTGGYAGTGTVAFEVGASGVTAINAASVYIDPVASAQSITSLLVSLTSTAPAGNILLINNTGAATIHGVFDTVNGIAATEGAAVVLGGNTYTLTYVGGDGNDVALVIPEPATIALLSLGLLAIRRKK
jgi:hypothetical protein